MENKAYFAENNIFQAESYIKKYVEHILRVSGEHSYSLDKDGNVSWAPKWTYPNALLFSVTTLTVIGNTIFKPQFF